MGYSWRVYVDGSFVGDEIAMSFLDNVNAWLDAELGVLPKDYKPGQPVTLPQLNKAVYDTTIQPVVNVGQSVVQSAENAGQAVVQSAVQTFAPVLLIGGTLVALFLLLKIVED